METTTVSSKGQIVIPKLIRDRLRLVPGTTLQIDVQGETLVMHRVVPSHPDWRTMRGMFGKRADLLAELAQERAAELAREDARTQSS
jgi:AbrB family looped-hinge helix DNA binding protein